MIEERLYNENDNYTATYVPKKSKAAISWGSVFAGTLTSLALSILFSFLVAGLGLSAVNMQSHNPLSGVGTIFNTFSALSVILSLAGGGFIAGRLAQKSGLIHGFLNWALMSLLTALLSLYAITSTLQMAGSAISTAASAGGQAFDGISNAFQNSSQGPASMWSSIFDSNTIDGKIKEAQETIKSSLNNTDIKALHTDNLQRAYNNASADVKTALERLKQKPGDFKNIAQDLLSKLKMRTDSIAQDINRDDVVKELESKGFSHQDAENAADSAISTYTGVRDDISAQLTKLEDTISNAPQSMDEVKDMAADKMDDAAKGVRNTALWAFFGGILSAAVSALAGMFGERSRYRHNHEIDYKRV